MFKRKRVYNKKTVIRSVIELLIIKIQIRKHKDKRRTYKVGFPKREYDIDLITWNGKQTFQSEIWVNLKVVLFL